MVTVSAGWPGYGSNTVAAPPSNPSATIDTEADEASAAEQFAGVPPPVPLHVQFQGPVPEKALTVPVLHRFVVGATDTATPAAEPQVPLIAPPTGVTGVEADDQLLSPTVLVVLTLHV